MTLPSVAVILLNWNNHEDTLHCVNLIKQVDYPSHLLKIVIVDNHSSDISRSELLESRGQYEFIPLAENMGFAAGNNAGIKYALDHEFDFVWILNSDVSFDAEILQKMLEVFSNHNNTGIVSPKIYFKNPPDTIWYAGGHRRLLSIGRVDGYGTLDTGQYDQLRQVDFGVGCCMLIHRSVFEKTGLFDENFFFYHEDIDLCYRAQAAGFSIWYQPTSQLIHNVSNSTKTQPALRYFHRAAGRAYFFRKYSQPIAFPGLLLTEIFRFLRLILVLGLQGQWSCVIAYLRGLISGWKFVK